MLHAAIQIGNFAQGAHARVMERIQRPITATQQHIASSAMQGSALIVAMVAGSAVYVTLSQV